MKQPSSGDSDVAIRGEGLAIETLWDAEETRPVERGARAMERRGGRLPAEFAARFRGDLSVELRPGRPTIVANLVSSVDGVVALGPSEHSTGGGEISGGSSPDRFMMSLLRGLADAVIVGAGTVRVGRNHEWTARKLQPALADVFARWRAEMGLAPQPTTIVVTSSGAVDRTHRGLTAPDVPVVIAPSIDAVTVALAARGLRLGLLEGGPHLVGAMAAANAVDELFLTIAPQLIGRPPELGRLGLVEGADLLGSGGRWGALSTVRRAGDELFLRYRFDR